MRVTQNFFYRSARFYIQRNSRRLLNIQEKVATQKRINRISDDTVNAPRLLNLKSSKARIEQFLKNVNRVDSLIEVQGTVLLQSEQAVSRIKELLLSEANEVTSTPETREAARLEIAAIASQLVQLANTQFAGDFIFSGFAVNTPAFDDTSVAVAPAGGNTGNAVVSLATVRDTAQADFDDYEIVFDASATMYDVVNTTTGATVVSGATYVSGQPIRFNGLEVQISDGTAPPGPPGANDTFLVTITPPGAYQGDGGVQRVEVQKGTFIQQNMLGDQVFQGVGLAGGVDVFAILNQINTALDTNDRAAIEAGLDQLDTARNQLASQGALVGARQNLLGEVKTRQEDIVFGLEILRSGLEDLDLAEALTQMNQEQLGFEAALGAAAAIVQSSLLDFLR